MQPGTLKNPIVTKYTKAVGLSWDMDSETHSKLLHKPRPENWNEGDGSGVKK